jgi:hypothetical protein
MDWLSFGMFVVAGSFFLWLFIINGDDFPDG